MMVVLVICGAGAGGGGGAGEVPMRMTGLLAPFVGLAPGSTRRGKAAAKADGDESDSNAMPTSQDSVVSAPPSVDRRGRRRAQATEDDSGVELSQESTVSAPAVTPARASRRAAAPEAEPPSSVEPTPVRRSSRARKPVTSESESEAAAAPPSATRRARKTASEQPETSEVAASQETVVSATPQTGRRTRRASQESESTAEAVTASQDTAVSSVASATPRRGRGRAAAEVPPSQESTATAASQDTTRLKRRTRSASASSVEDDVDADRTESESEVSEAETKLPAAKSRRTAAVAATSTVDRLPTISEEPEEQAPYADVDAEMDWDALAAAAAAAGNRAVATTIESAADAEGVLKVARHVASVRLGADSISLQSGVKDATYLRYEQSVGIHGGAVAAAAKEAAPSVDLEELAHKLTSKKEEVKEPETAGDKWFNLPAPKMTPELKRDLQILKMRSYLDPKRFYKGMDSKELPKFFHVGTVVEGPSEFFTQRLTNKERRPTIAKQLLADDSFTQYAKKHYDQITNKARSGNRSSYKRRTTERGPQWKR